MNFWDLYWPLLAALMSSWLISEVFHMGLGYHLHRKQEKRVKEIEDKIARGEINPMELYGGMGGGMPMMGGGPGFMPAPPEVTVSGEPKETGKYEGQYL